MIEVYLRYSDNLEDVYRLGRFAIRHLGNLVDSIARYGVYMPDCNDEFSNAFGEYEVIDNGQVVFMVVVD